MAVFERKHIKKRDAILVVLRATGDHPCAQWVYDQLKPGIPDLSLGTVYRNLRGFRREGLAASLGVVNGEERFDGIAEPHPHFVCSRCGAVIDVPPDEREALMAALEHLSGGEITANGGNTSGSGRRFIIDFRKTVFYGVCKACQNLPEKVP
ncbi:MAG: transcriptional repressor [Treponema sp.]|jgi:Fur family peroxide stress response transcriptional regulator|nr:transcriptional repressor [Treponema sp.]